MHLPCTSTPTRRRAAGLVATALLATTVWTALPASAAGGTGSISGVVTGRADAPVAGVTVELPVFVDGCSRLLTTTTDGQGRFVLTDVPEGGYASLAFRTTSEDYVEVSYAGHRSRAFGPDATTVQVRAGQTTSVTERLIAAGTLNGTLTDARGLPVRGQAVLLRPLPKFAADQRTFFEFSRFTPSDELGRFSFTRIPPGGAVVFSSGGGGNGDGFNGGALTADAAPVLDLPEGGTTQTSVPLPVGASVQVKVVLPDRDTLPQQVGAFAQRADIGFGAGGTPPGADGYSTISGLSSATRTVVVRDFRPEAEREYPVTSLTDSTGRPVVVTPDPDRVQRFEVAVPAGRSISGTVRGADGRGLSGVFVSAQGPTDEANGFTTTAQDGTYRIPALAPGAYRVSFSGSAGFSYYDSTQDVAQATLVDVSPSASPTAGTYRRTPQGAEGVDQALTGTAPATPCPSPVTASPSASPSVSPVVVTPSSPAPTTTPTSPSPTTSPSPAASASPSPSATRQTPQDGSGGGSGGDPFTAPVGGGSSGGATGTGTPSSGTPASGAATAGPTSGATSGPTTGPSSGPSSAAPSGGAPVATPQQVAVAGAAVSSAISSLPPTLPPSVATAAGSSLMLAVQELAVRSGGDPAAVRRSAGQRHGSGRPARAGAARRPGSGCRDGGAGGRRPRRAPARSAGGAGARAHERGGDGGEQRAAVAGRRPAGRGLAAERRRRRAGRVRDAADPDRPADPRAQHGDRRRRRHDRR